MVLELISLTNLELTRFFFAIVLLLISAHFFGYFFQRFKMPRIIGEILGGLVLGPTLLGHFCPQIYTWIFNSFEFEGKLISVISWIGLILLMFISGFEIQKTFTKDDKKTVFFILFFATLIPFLAGWFAPNFYDFSSFIGIQNNFLALKIVIAIAIAVTSIPVISKIFIDLDIMKTHFAKIVLAVATIEDVILWIALAIATGLVSSSKITLYSIVLTVLITLAFFILGLFLMPRLINKTNNLRVNLFIKSSVSGYIIFICFFFAALASLLNINVIFGAFLAGIIIGKILEDRFEKAKATIKEVSLGFFVPIYFAVVGLKLDLIHNLDILFFLGFLLFAVLFKTIGTLLAARINKKDWLSSANLAVAMNTRGGPGIILATVSFDLGIINDNFFVVLVLLAIFTSFFAGYWFKFVLSRGWALLKDEGKKDIEENNLKV